MTNILEGLPYRFRYMDGKISKGGFKTFEKAVENFINCKHSGRYGTLYSKLKDVVCVEREKDCLQL